jgi:hypothetical protein
MSKGGILASGHGLAASLLVRTILVPVLVAASSPVATIHAATEWAVPQADLRFTLKLASRPTHASAGYFAHLPDGGILPGPHPVTTVVASSGKGRNAKPRVVDSHTLWHSKTGGLSLVFADPGKNAGSVDIYVGGGTKPQLWSPASGLTPSTILCVEPGKASLRDARNLARLGTVGPTVHVRNKAGVKQAPFSIGGDDTGRPRPASFYFLTHVAVTDPGNTWIAPFTIDGETEVLVNGRKITPKQRIEKWGGTGEYVNLTEGLHRIEVFQTAPGSGSYSSHGRKGGLMYLTWRTPHATMKELGGVRSDKVPMSGTSRMETRVLNNGEIVRSGGYTLEGALTRTGAPVACARVRPTHTFWFGDEPPLLTYELQAITAGHPKDATYTWELPGGATVTGAGTRWIFPGLFENRVTLTARSKAGTTRAVAPFHGWGTAQTSLADPAHRRAFRDTLTTMVQSYPTDPDPVASWSSALWNNLIRTTEQGEGYDLLHNLFTTRWDTTRKKLSPAQAVALQDIFLDMHQQRNPKDALTLIDGFHKSFDEGIRRDSLLIRKAEVYMYYLKDRESAARGLEAFSERQGNIAEWARIRQGDLAFLSGDLNKATQLYADVQKAARRQRNQPDRLVTEDLLGKSAAAAPNKEEKTKKERRIGNPRPLGRKDGGEETAPDPPAPPSPGEVLPYRGSNWRVGALRDVSNSENVEKLIDGGFLLEAHQALRAWEREFPLSKISGDLLLVEAKYHMKLRDWQRARVMLEAYCREVDASSFLPDAVRMLVTCVTEMKAPRHEVRDVVEKVKKRLEYHPVARELEEFLAK